MKLKAHIKIDTGMNRIGIPHNIAADFIKKVQNTDYIDLRGVLPILQMLNQIRF